MVEITWSNTVLDVLVSKCARHDCRRSRTHLEGRFNIMPQINKAVRESEAKRLLPLVEEGAAEELSGDKLPLADEDPLPVVELPVEVEGRASGMALLLLLRPTSWQLAASAADL